MTHIPINFKRYYKNLSILIPAVALFIGVFYFAISNFPDNNSLKFHIIHSFIFTSGIWLGCSFIISYLWVKVPWEYYPIKRLFIEIPLIIIYTLTFSGSVVWYEVKEGFLNLEKIDVANEIIITLLITLLISSIHESVFFYKQWKYNFSRSVRLEKDNIEAKYETLKTQINPHFLFNSLNSLTNLVEDNNKAVNYISNLSDFLRYVLKSRDKELVLIREEIIILKKYIELQQSRFTNNLMVKLNIPESFYHYSIPPLILQMLFENCIKHNIISSEKPLQISIFTEDDKIVVENSLQKKTSQNSTGQGLNNIIERYRYFTTQEVKIEKLKDTFSVKIPLLIISE